MRVVAEASQKDLKGNRGLRSSNKSDSSTRDYRGTTRPSWLLSQERVRGMWDAASKPRVGGGVVLVGDESVFAILSTLTSERALNVSSNNPTPW